ncbi:GNAT family N-acetyltransferase [Pontibacter anaerobius]|uniref:GNAT family N-acetyltransferase n=1 Tax=Pontibacter anaerobius TaxID=2993940 RepID=A0ABT3RAX2_9BACT|nr:GNAT family N-acetyltransferase [Pontibacter anaerobius]MCX2738460.1 GNAT family N-acetyltransferase [Pontibacter anaerobius]
MFEIKYLYEVPQHFDTVADWIYRQWWQKPGSTADVVKTPLREHMQAQPLPAAFVALEGDKPVGSVLLIESDGVDALPDLKPWLAALYVLPEYRGQGVGKLLVQALEQHAQQADFTDLYLVATDRVSFYYDLGWRVYTKLVGKTGITIMHKSMAADPVTTGNSK